MINTIFHKIVLALVAAIGAFFRTLVRESHAATGDVVEDQPPLDGEELVNKLAATLNGEDGPDPRLVSPFKHHMARYFKTTENLTRTEIVENMLLSLDSLGEEIVEVADGVVKCYIEQESDDKHVLLYGHLDWKLDKINPDVYSISMDLLKDGFTFRADSKTFVITSRIEK